MFDSICSVLYWFKPLRRRTLCLLPAISYRHHPTGSIYRCFGNQLDLPAFPPAFLSMPQFILWATISKMGMWYLLPKSEAPALLRNSPVPPLLWSMAGQVWYWLKSIHDESYYHKLPLLIENTALAKHLMIQLVINTSEQKVYWQIFRKSKIDRTKPHNVFEEDIYTSLNLLWEKMSELNIDLILLQWGAKGQWEGVEFSQRGYPLKGRVRLPEGVNTLESAILRPEGEALPIGATLMHPVVILDLVDQISSEAEGSSKNNTIPVQESTTGDYATLLTLNESGVGGHLVWLKNRSGLSDESLLSLQSGATASLFSGLNHPVAAYLLSLNAPLSISSPTSQRLSYFITDLLLSDGLNSAINMMHSLPSGKFDPDDSSVVTLSGSPVSLRETEPLLPVIDPFYPEWAASSEHVHQRGGGGAQSAGGTGISLSDGRSGQSSSGLVPDHGTNADEEFSSSDDEDPPHDLPMDVVAEGSVGQSRKRPRSFSTISPSAKRASPDDIDQIEKARDEMSGWQFIRLKPRKGKSDYLDVITDVINLRRYADCTPPSGLMSTEEVYSLLKGVYDSIECMTTTWDKTLLINPVRGQSPGVLPSSEDIGPESVGLIYLVFHLWFSEYRMAVHPHQNDQIKQIDQLRDRLIDDQTLSLSQLFESIVGQDQRVITLQTRKGYESWHTTSFVDQITASDHPVLQKKYQSRFHYFPVRLPMLTLEGAEPNRFSGMGIDDLQRRLGIFETNIKGKETEIKQLKEQIAKDRHQFLEQISEAESQQAAFILQLSSLEQQKNQALSRLTRLKRDLEQSQNDLHQLRVALLANEAEQRQQVEGGILQEVDNEHREQTLEELADMALQFGSEAEDIGGQVSDLRDQQEQQEQLLYAAEEEKRQLLGQIQKLEEQVVSQREIQQTLENERAVLTEQQSRQQADLEQIRQQQVAGLKDKEALEQQVQTNKKQLADKQKELEVGRAFAMHIAEREDQLLVEKRALSQELKEERSNKRTLENEVSELKVYVKAYQSTIRKKERELQTSRSSGKTMTGQLQQLRDDLAEIIESLALKESLLLHEKTQLKDLNQAFKTKVEEIKQLEQSRQEQEKKRQYSEEALVRVESEFHEKEQQMQTELESRSAEISRLQEKMTVNEQGNRELVQAFSLAQLMLRGQKEKISTLNEALETQKQQLDASQASHEQTEQELSQSRQQVTRSLDLLVAADTQKKWVEGRLTREQEQLRSTQLRVEQSSATVNQQSHDIEQLKEKLQESERLLTERQRQFDTRNQQVLTEATHALKEKRVLQEKLAEVESKVLSRRHNYQRINEELDILERQSADLQEQLSATQDSRERLKGILLITRAEKNLLLRGWRKKNRQLLKQPMKISA